MRDNHDDMIELLDTDKSNNIYSSIIQFRINGENLKLRFGIIPSDYDRLKRIVEFRPFENTGVAPYRYFFAFSFKNDPSNTELSFISVRVEQLDRHKQFEFQLSKKYISNLLWFKELTNKDAIEGMIEK